MAAGTIDCRCLQHRLRFEQHIQLLASRQNAFSSRYLPLLHHLHRYKSFEARPDRCQKEAWLDPASPDLTSLASPASLHSFIDRFNSTSSLIFAQGFDILSLDLLT